MRASTIPGFCLDIADGDPKAAVYTFVDVRGSEVCTLTREALDTRTTAIARALLERGARRTAIVLPPGPDLVIAFLGAMRAGATPVLCEPRGRKANSGDRLDAILDDCRPTHVIVPAEGGSLPETEASVTDVAALEAHGAALDTTLPPLRADQPAYLQYTSGSTGRAKGTMVTFRNLANNLAAIAEAMGLHEKSVGVIWLPPYHDMGLVGGILAPLEARSHVVLMRTEDFVRRPLTWLRTISRYRATVTGGPMFGWRQAIDRCRIEDTAGLDLSSLCTAFVGAEPIDPVTLAAFAKRYADNGFRAQAFLPCYGLAEATLFVSAAPRGLGAITRPRAPGSRLLDTDCGAVWRDFDIRIVDPETGCEMGEGQIGEIWLAGPSVAHDLASGASLATQRMEGSLQPYLATGDLGYMRDGSLSITGRIKAVVKVNGRKVGAEDVEAIVRASVPIAHGVAAYSPAYLGSGDRLEIMVELPKTEAGEAWQKIVSEAVYASLGIVPARVQTVSRGSIPRTVSGKIDRVGTAALSLDA